jgi:hypothetical protein
LGKLCMLKPHQLSLKLPKISLLFYHLNLSIKEMRRQQ